MYIKTFIIFEICCLFLFLNLSRPLSATDNIALSASDGRAASSSTADDETPKYNLSTRQGPIATCLEPALFMPTVNFDDCRQVAAAFAHGDIIVRLKRSNPSGSRDVLLSPYYLRRRSCTLTLRLLPTWHGNSAEFYRAWTVENILKIARMCTRRPSEHREQLYQWGGFIDDGWYRFRLIIAKDASQAEEGNNNTEAVHQPELES